MALNLWATGRREEAAAHFESLGSQPDFGPFYVARGHLLSQLRGVDPTADLRRGVASDPDSWALHIQLIRHLEEEGRWTEALAALEQARARFPDDFNLDLFQVRALINTGRALEATEILDDIQVLPSENARGSHRLYEQAHTLVALDAMDRAEFALAREHLRTALQWPESVGQGKPYEPEERLIRLLLGRTETHLGNQNGADAAFQAVADVTTEPATWGGNLEALVEPTLRPSRLDLLALPAFRALGSAAAFRVPPWAVGELEEIAERLASELPDLFGDLDGRMILRALRQP
jgi:tetratricopeptide (TPR) repeat protein